jgi:hypothetical protein
MKLLCLTLLLLGTGGTPAPAQDAPYDMPPDLQPFWSQYYAAKQVDDEAAMDKAVRTYQDKALVALDLLIDDASMRERPELPDELRALAWSLDRTQGQSRFIERVRYVLDLSLADRRNRRETVRKLDEAFEVLREARTERSVEGWQRAAAAFEPLLHRFEQLGDTEQTIICLRQLAETERARGLRWEQARTLKRLVEAAGKLAYREVLAEEASGELARLLAEGIDPDGERPPDSGGAPADVGEGVSGAGRGLTSFKAGAVEHVFQLEQVSAKKGISNVALPSFVPPEQFLLWDYAFLQDDGPMEFDIARAAHLQPFGVPMMLSRDGLQFALDTNGDGTPDVKFTPTSTPQLVELPAGDGQHTYPVMICTPSDKESMFGLDVNYSVQMNTARLRFNVGGYMEGKVLGDTWRIYDSNLTGRYGDEVENWDDRYTRYDEQLPHAWFDADAVQLGKSRVALPFSPVLPVGDAFYRATLDPDGARLTLHELNLETGAIRLDMATAVAPAFVLVRETGKLEGSTFNVVPAKKGGSVTVPVGTYVLAGGRIESGKKTSMKHARIYKGTSAPFEVKAGETHVLSLGAPYTIDAETRVERGRTIVVGRSLRVFGRGGEEYAMLFDDALQPEVEARTAGGKKVQKPERMRKPDISAWQENKGPDNILWFPLDMEIETPDGETLVLRLTEKSHVLLGGPLAGGGTP